MPEIEVKIWTIEKGKLKEIMIPEFDNQIFVVKQKKETTLDKAYNAVKDFNEEKIKRQIKNPKSLDVGKAIKLSDKQVIHTNVLKECKELANKGYYNFVPIMKKYYPGLATLTYTRYAFNYRKYLGIKVGRGRKTTKETFKMPTIKTTENIKKRKRRKRRRKPANAEGFNKKYNVWIYKDHLQKIKLAINTVGWNYVPNSKAIRQKTGLTKGRISATLDYMITKGMTKRIFKDGTYVYEMI